MLPASAVNALRRQALEGLEAALAQRYAAGTVNGKLAA